MSGKSSPRTPSAERPAARRARRPSLSEAEFLKKALEVFVDRGFEGASIDAITASAGIAKRTIYARYGDKEGLFKAAIKRGIDDWIVPLDHLRAAETDDLESTLLAVGRILVNNVLTPAGLRLLRLTNAVSGRMPAISEHNVRYGQDPTIAYLTDLFRRKLPGAAADPARAEEAAEVFLHLVVGGPANAAAWGVTRDKSAVEQRTRLSVQIFLHGMVCMFRGENPLEKQEASPDRLSRIAAALDEASESLSLARAHLHTTTP